MAKTFTVSDELGALIESTAEKQGMEPTAVILEAVEQYTGICPYDGEPVVLAAPKQGDLRWEDR